MYSSTELTLITASGKSFQIADGKRKSINMS